MSTVFDDAINACLEANGGVEDETIKAIKKLQQEAGDVSDFEALTLIRQLFDCAKTPQEPENEYKSESTARAQQKSSSEISEGDKKILEENIETLKNFFDKKTYTYKFKMVSDVTGRFIVKSIEDNLPISTYVYICATPHHCEVRAYYPFDGTPDMLYPLSATMIKRNREHLYGDLQFSENFKDIYYHYRFRTVNGINLDDFNLYFYGVTHIAREYFAEIKSICNCNFDDSEKDKILDNLKNLANRIVNAES